MIYEYSLSTTLVLFFRRLNREVRYIPHSKTISITIMDDMSSENVIASQYTHKVRPICAIA